VKNLGLAVFTRHFEVASDFNEPNLDGIPGKKQPSADLCYPIVTKKVTRKPPSNRGSSLYGRKPVAGILFLVAAYNFSDSDFPPSFAAAFTETATGRDRSSTAPRAGSLRQKKAPEHFGACFEKHQNGQGVAAVGRAVVSG
jgi:hypothetical protein